MECPDCGEPVTEADSACPSCGKSLIGLNQNDQDSKEYTCRTCGEELEFISTYKQWYCYTCQEYMDLPEPTANDLPPELEEKPVELKNNQSSIDLSSGEDENVAELDLESSEEISWDEGEETTDEDFEGDAVEDISDDTPENDADDVDDGRVGIGAFKDDMDDDAEETELSWDEDEGSPPEEKPKDGYVDSDLSNESTINKVEIKESIDDEDMDIDFESDDASLEDEFEISDSIEIDEGSGNDASTIGHLHQAWLRVNNILGLAPEDSRVIELEKKLKNALAGKLEQNDAIALANSSLKEVAKLEKELKDMIHHNVSDLFHFVNSKLFLAKKIGFTVDDLEEELDNVSSLIARSEYHQAHDDLEDLLNRLFELPKTQDEIMIGLDGKSEIIQELLEPRAKKNP